MGSVGGATGGVGVDGAGIVRAEDDIVDVVGCVGGVVGGKEDDSVFWVSCWDHHDQAISAKVYRVSICCLKS